MTRERHAHGSGAAMMAIEPTDRHYQFLAKGVYIRCSIRGREMKDADWGGAAARRRRHIFRWARGESRQPAREIIFPSASLFSGRPGRSRVILSAKYQHA